MNDFNTTQIIEESESLGTLLKEAREAKGLSIEELHTITKIKVIHLQAMEENRFQQIAAPVYARGFLRICAKALDLEPEDLVRQYNAHFAPEEKKTFLTAKKEPVKKKQTKLILGIVLIVIGCLLLLLRSL